MWKNIFAEEKHWIVIDSMKWRLVWRRIELDNQHKDLFVFMAGRFHSMLTCIVSVRPPVTWNKEKHIKNKNKKRGKKKGNRKAVLVCTFFKKTHAPSKLKALKRSWPRLFTIAHIILHAEKSKLEKAFLCVFVNSLEELCDERWGPRPALEPSSSEWPDPLPSKSRSIPASVDGCLRLQSGKVCTMKDYDHSSCHRFSQVDRWYSGIKPTCLVHLKNFIASS